MSIDLFLFALFTCSYKEIIIYGSLRKLRNDRKEGEEGKAVAVWSGLGDGPAGSFL